MPQTSPARRSVVGERPQEDTIVSVERAFEIVAMLADLEEGASLADIARHLDVNKVIAVKLLASLEPLGLAAQTNRMSERALVTCSPQLLATVERLAEIWPLEPRTCVSC